MEIPVYIIYNYIYIYACQLTHDAELVQVTMHTQATYVPLKRGTKARPFCFGPPEEAPQVHSTHTHTHVAC